MIVCPYCRGSKFNRHDKPDELSADFWEKAIGPLGLCVVCKGHGRVTQSVFNETGEQGMAILTTASGKLLGSCSQKGCRKWIDLSGFLHPEGIKIGATCRCSDGHEIIFEVTL